MSQSLRKQVLRLFITAAFGMLLLAAPGCSDEKDFSRSTNLLAFFDPADQRPTDVLLVSIFGGETTLHVRSDVGYSLKFRTGDKQSDWLHIDTLGFDANLQAMKYRITCAPIPEGTFERRTGTISLVHPEEYQGQFIVVKQGFGTRLKEEFAWLNTGSDIPFVTTGEKLFKDWTAVQKEIGWRAPLVADQTESYLYSKKGYIKLGDGVHATDVLTPDLAKMVPDSIVILAFKAVAYAAQDGTQDGNELTVSVENGGRFLDGTKQVVLTLPYYDPSDPDVAKNMWNRTTQAFMLVTDKNEKFTNETTIRFSTPAGSNRAFLDDVILYTVDKDSFKAFGEELEEYFSNHNL